MNRRTLNHAVYGGVAGLSVLLAQLSACSSESNDKPGSTTVVTGGQSGVGGSGKGGSGKGGNASGGDDGQGGDVGQGGEDDPGAGGVDNTAGGQGGGGAVDNGCVPEQTDDDCWTCPEEPIQFLNQCNSAQCAAFVNDQTNLPLLNEDGSLPELP